MTKHKVYLAVDIGAGSGRVVAGILQKERLRLEEVYRFSNDPVKLTGSLHWNAPGLFLEIKHGIRKAAAKYGKALACAGVDTWGVDYGYLDKHGRLLGIPFCYRDQRTDDVSKALFEIIPSREIYETTGIQFMFFNTLFQIYSEVLDGSPVHNTADRLLFMPDLINYWLTGVKTNESTIASTSQMIDARSGLWARNMLKKLGIPSSFLAETVDPCSCIGHLLPDIAEETGAGKLNVVAPGCHDTASAVAAVPAAGSNYVYISSGTWSLMGFLSKKPVITDKSFEHGFTNERGVENDYRILKNISGLWIIQECRKKWAAEGQEMNYDTLTSLASGAKPFAAFIYPDWSGFAKPGDMPSRIKDFCRKTGQKAPGDTGSIVRTALEALALRYRSVLSNIEEIRGEKVDTIHIVGGGCLNTLLNQFAADATGKRVVAGPTEATATGNIMAQLLADGMIASLNEGRDILKESIETNVYEPGDRGRWEDAYSSYIKIEGILQAQRF
ncbi:MAG: rhamnulokinase [Verrucomicrobiota bacterium]